MRVTSTIVGVWLAILCAPLSADETGRGQSPNQQPGRDSLKATAPVDVRRQDSWTRALDDPAQRGTLSNRAERVRGDSGKWNDDARLQHAPPIHEKPADMSLDDWADHLLEKKFQLSSNDDNWLIFRSRQLDDNDRLWVERIERRGSQFTVVVSEAVWQGNYRKNFTYYNVVGVNLGRLDPGKYEAQWIIQPLVFDKFEGPASERDNWPQNQRPVEKKPVVLPVTFTVVAPAPQ